MRPENQQKSRANNAVVKVGFKDLIAICLAVYQLVFPRILSMIAVIVFIAGLLYWFLTP